MTENVFEAVKLSVSTREVAAFYGIEVKRNGMACCPFHDDKNPSMKVDQRFHCFGCGADGDVIDFTAKLFDLDPIKRCRISGADRLLDCFKYILCHVPLTAGLFHRRLVSGGFCSLTGSFATLGAVWLPD